VAACCRYVDLAVFGQFDAEQARVPADLVEQVLLDCGRPLLVVPFNARQREVGRRVVIGWNASAQAARAVGDAMPFLREAEFVGLMTFQGPAGGGGPPMPPADIAAHLALHGVRATVQQAVRERDGIGATEALQNYAFECQADLTVVGARSSAFPLRHAGAEARELLRAMATPLLAAH
jgi:hypothetical protein